MNPDDIDAVVEAVGNHPRVVMIGRTVAEQHRINAFARDLARWLCGVDRDHLEPLARVVTVVAGRELRDARALCRGRPILAVEAAARATQTIWPLLKWPLEPDNPPAPEEPAGEEGEGDGGDDEAISDQGAGQGGAGATSDEEGEGEAHQDPTGEPGDGDKGAAEPEEPADPFDVLAKLAGVRAAGADTDDLDPAAEKELERLASALEAAMGDGSDPEVAAAELLADVGTNACDGALEADKAASLLERFMPGVGWSLAPGALRRTLLERLDKLADLIDRLPQLEEIADALGRIESGDQDRGIAEGGGEEVVGVRLGGNIEDVLPSELALLSDPSTEDLFYQRFVERRLIALELSGEGMDGVSDPDKKGPVIACIDTSASMRGAPEMAAKALVLAVCRRVLPQRRTLHLLLFGGPGEWTELRLRSGLGGLEDLLEFLTMSFDAGTDFDGPLLRAMELLDERDLERADVLVVTDGLGRASKEVIARVDAERAKRDFQIWSVVLGSHDDWGVRKFSDAIWALVPDEAAKAAGLIRRFG